MVSDVAQKCGMLTATLNVLDLIDDELPHGLALFVSILRNRVFFFVVFS